VNIYIKIGKNISQFDFFFLISFLIPTPKKIFNKLILELVVFLIFMDAFFYKDRKETKKLFLKENIKRNSKVLLKKV
jgi:hypothetical protein